MRVSTAADAGEGSSRLARPMKGDDSRVVFQLRALRTRLLCVGGWRSLPSACHQRSCFCVAPA